MPKSGFQHTAVMNDRIVYVPVEWIMQNVEASIDIEGDDWLLGLFTHKAPYCASHIRNIEENGFRVPIVIQIRRTWGGREYFCMGNGHHRLTSAILLALDVIPVYFSTGDYMCTEVSASEDLDVFIDGISDIRSLLREVEEAY